MATLTTRPTVLFAAALVIAMIGLAISHSGAQEEEDEESQRSLISKSDLEKIAHKLKSIDERYDTLLAAVEQIKAELQIVKVRVTH